MSTIHLKDQVREAVGLEWPAFESRHPNLARLLDQDAVIEEAAAQLADDPEYKKAMDEAAAIGMTTQTLFGIARNFIQDWLSRLVF